MPIKQQNTAPFDSDAQRFILAAGISNKIQGMAINYFVQGLKANNLWTKCNAIYPMVGGIAASHKFNLINPRDSDIAFRLTFYGTITHAYKGITGDGSSGTYIDTHYNPATNGSQDNASLGDYCRTAGSQNVADIGAHTGIGGSFYFALFSSYGGSFYGDVNDAEATSTTNTNSQGFNAASRSSSSSKIHSIRGANTTKTENSTGLTNYNVYLLTYNDSGTAGGKSTKQYTMFFIGTGLTGTQLTNYNNYVNTLMTLLSRSY